VPRQLASKQCLGSVKSSHVISHVIVELGYDVSEAISITGDWYENVVYAQYRYTELLPIAGPHLLNGGKVTLSLKSCPSVDHIGNS
jgi:hypothetical protein